MSDVVIRFKAEGGNLAATTKDAAKQFELLEAAAKGAQDNLNKAQAELERRTQATGAATKQLVAITNEYRAAQARATEAAQQSAAAQRELVAAQRAVATAQKTNQRGDGAAGPDSAQLSAAVARLQAAEAATNRFREAQEQARSELAAVGTRMNAAREQVDRYRAAQSEAKDEVTKATKALADASGVLQASKKNAKEYADSIKAGQEAIALGASAIAGSLLLIGKSALETGIKFEQLRTALKTGLGSDAGAEAAFTRIQNFAAATPFTVDQVTESFVKLQNRGVKPTEDTLRRLGDLTASQGKGLDQITEALLDAQTGEFERLKEFGIKAKDAGDQITFSFKGVNQTVDKTPEAITKAILSFGELKGVAGGMAAQSKTLGGQLSNLQDNTDKLGQAFFAVAEGPVKAFVGGANALLSAFLGLPAPVQQTLLATTAFGGVLVAAVAVLTSYQLLLKSAVVGNTLLAARQALTTVQTNLYNTAQLAAAVATRQATAAQAAQVAQLGKLALTAGLTAAAFASVALVAETYSSINKGADETRKSVEGVNQSLKALDELQQANAKSADSQSAASDRQASSLEKAQESIGGIQRALDVLRNVLNAFSFNNLLKQFAKLEAIPQPVRDLINNIANAFPKLQTAAEASAQASDAALGDLVVSAESASNAFSNLKVKGFDKATKEEVDELTNAIDQSITAVEKSDLEAGKKKAYLNSLRAQKAELEQVNQRIKDQGQSLSVLGTEQEQLAKKNAKLTDKLARGIGTNDDAKQLIEIINRQREVGQVSVEEAERQLDAIRGNSRLSVETIQSAEKSIQGIKKDSLDQQVADLQQQQEAIANRVTAGNLSQAAADKQLTELKKQELDKRLQAAKDALQAEIDAGRGDGSRAKQLALEIKKTESEVSKVNAEAAKRDREERLKDFDEQQALLEAQYSKQLIGRREFAERSLAIGKQKADEEIKQLQGQLAQLDATDIQGREELNAKIAGVEKRKADIQREFNRQIREERLKDFDEQQGLLEARLTRGLVTEQQFAQQSLSIGQRKADEELVQLRQQLSELAATDKDGREEINLKIEEVLARREKLQQDYFRREVELMERAAQEATDAITLAETERNIEIQKLLNDGVINEEEANQRKLKATAETLDAELKLAQDNLAKLQALPKLNDPAAEADRQAKIRAAQQNQANLQNQILQNQAAQEEALRQAAIKGIQNQAKAAETASKLQVASLERVKAAQDAIAKSLERQQRLTQAQQNLDRARESAAQSAGDQELTNLDRALALRKLLEETDNPEKKQIIQQELTRLGLAGEQSELQILQKRQEVEDTIARNKLQALAAEQERQRVNLELDLRREEAAARRAVIEAQIAEVQAQQQVIAAQASVREAEQIKDPEQRKLAVDSANAQLGLAQQGLGLAQAATGAAQQGVQDQAETAQKARDALAVQQANETATANAAEKTREVDQALALADAKAASLADKMKSAADSSAQIKSNLEGIGGASAPTLAPVTPREAGGPVVPGRDYLIGEKGPEVVRFGQPGMVYSNKNPITQAALSPSAAMPAVNLSQADVVAAIAKLQKTMSNLPVGDLNNTNIFQGRDWSPDLTAYYVAQELMRFQR